MNDHIGRRLATRSGEERMKRPNVQLVGDRSLGAIPP